MAAPRKYLYTDEDMQTAINNGLNRKTVIERLKRGWSLHDAVTVKTKRNRLPLSLVEKAEENGISKQTLRARLYRGWSIEEATTTPTDKNKAAINKRSSASKQNLYGYYQSGELKKTGVASELAEQIGVETSTVYSMARDKRMQSYKRGHVFDYTKHIGSRVGIYAMYRGERNVAQGTLEEIAEATGLSVTTVRNHVYAYNNKQAAVVKIDEEDVLFPEYEEDEGCPKNPNQPSNRKTSRKEFNKRRINQ